ncbi:hypothetical protein TorRG33x02_235750, partial [Trema orientale]
EVNVQDVAASSSFKKINVQGPHELVHGVRASAEAHGVVHDVSHASGSKSTKEFNMDCPGIVSDGNFLDLSAREITGGGLAAKVAHKEPVDSSMIAMHKVVDTTLARNDKSALAGRVIGGLDLTVIGQVKSVVARVNSSTS